MVSCDEGSSLHQELFRKGWCIKNMDMYTFLDTLIQGMLVIEEIESLLLTIAPHVLNIGRYLLFCMLPIQYRKIVRHIVCSKKQPIFEISTDKSPDIER